MWRDWIGKILHADAREVLAALPDKAVDVLLTDPPYGMPGREAGPPPQGSGVASKRGRFGNKNSRFEKYRKMAGAGHWKYGDEMTAWDVAPGPEVFREMFRVSKEQIIWGGNYFELPATRCFNVWRKLTISEGFSMAMCEYAWTSYKTNAKWWEFAPQDAERFHPTQKPLALICRQLEEYTKPGDLVLDCYSGSGTVAVACHMLGRRFIAVEKNAIYWEKSVARLEAVQAQGLLF